MGNLWGLLDEYFCYTLRSQILPGIEILEMVPLLSVPPIIQFQNFQKKHKKINNLREFEIKNNYLKNDNILNNFKKIE